MRRNAILAIGFLMVGCGGSDSAEDEFVQATPKMSAISIDVPAGAGGSTTASEGVDVAARALIGETATFYRFTREVSDAVNGGVRNMLNIIEDIVSHRPAAREANKAVWGPITSGLSPAVYALVVERTAPRQFNYVLTGKPKGADDTQWKALVAGHAFVVSRAFGSGSFLVDFDAIHALDASHQATGGIAVHYSNIDNPRVVEVGFKNFVGKLGEVANDALYRYAERRDHSGNFEFLALADLDGDGASKEVLAVLTRWNADGTGRADVGAAGGSLADIKMHAQECWGSNFGRTYYTDNLNINPTEGDPASCAF